MLDGNAGQAPGSPAYVNVKGMMLGNAWTNPELDTLGVMEHWYSHSHISTSTYNAVIASCNFTSGEGPVRLLSSVARSLYGDAATDAAHIGGSSRKRLHDAACDAASDAANFEAGLNRGATTPVDIYMLFDDRPTFDYTCELDSRPVGQGEQLLRTIAGLPSRREQGVKNARRLMSHKDGDNNNGFPFEDSCIDDHVHVYLNRPDVQAALHVRSDAKTWYMCTSSSELKYTDADVFASLLDTHREIIATGLIRTMIFSGDVDGIVPTAGSRNWIESLGMAPLSVWSPWYATSADHFGRQLGGMYVQYDQGKGQTFTFASIRGAGHMTSYTQPGRSLALFDAFVHNRLPASEAFRAHA